MKVGFIGVGNMGGPMCRNIIKRSNHQVTVFDLNAAAVKACTSELHRPPPPPPPPTEAEEERPRA